MSDELSGELHRGGQVVLDANGNGTVTLYPDHAQQRWEVRHVVVQTSQAATAIPIPVAQLYVNIVDPVHSRGATASGSQDIFDGNIRIGPSDLLLVVWTGGIPGTVASVTVEGDFYTRRS